MRLGLIACLVLALAAMYLRGREFIEQDVRWDENAYGSVVWTLLGLHAGHLLAVAGETLFLLVVARRGDHVDDHHRLDMRTLAVYWYFVVGSWVLIYGVIYLSPRLIGRLDLGGPG